MRFIPRKYPQKSKTQSISLTYVSFCLITCHAFAENFEPLIKKCILCSIVATPFWWVRVKMAHFAVLGNTKHKRRIHTKFLGTEAKNQTETLESSAFIGNAFLIFACRNLKYLFEYQTHLRVYNFTCLCGVIAVITLATDVWSVARHQTGNVGRQFGKLTYRERTWRNGIKEKGNIWPNLI